MSMDDCPVSIFIENVTGKQENYFNDKWTI